MNVSIPNSTDIVNSYRFYTKLYKIVYMLSFSYIILIERLVILH